MRITDQQRQTSARETVRALDRLLGGEAWSQDAANGLARALESLGFTGISDSVARQWVENRNARLAAEDAENGLSS